MITWEQTPPRAMTRGSASPLRDQLVVHDLVVARPLELQLEPQVGDGPVELLLVVGLAQGEGELGDEPPFPMA